MNKKKFNSPMEQESYEREIIEQYVQRYGSEYILALIEKDKEKTKKVEESEAMFDENSDYWKAKKLDKLMAQGDNDKGVSIHNV